MPQRPGQAPGRSRESDQHPDRLPAPDPAGTPTGTPGGTGRLGGGTRLVLVRHGVTDYTVGGRLDGRGGADPPLNAQGRAQADAVAALVPQLLRASATARRALVPVVTSSLRRVRMTAEPIAEALGVTPSVDADWDERGFGHWDGLTMAQLHQRFPDDVARMLQDPGYPPPHGESRTQVTERVLGALERVLAGTPGQPGAGADPRTVVVVTSRLPLLIVLGHALSIGPERFWALATAPASVSVVDFWPDGQVSVPLVNRTEHLQASDAR